MGAGSPRLDRAVSGVDMCVALSRMGPMGMQPFSVYGFMTSKAQLKPRYGFMSLKPYALYFTVL